MLPQKLRSELAELRLDVRAAHQGKLRVGFAIAAATILVTASGWPPGDTIQRALFYVLAALPCTAIGLGLIVNELIHTRADRLGAEEADDREFEVLRGHIAEALARRTGLEPSVEPSFEPSPSLPVAVGGPPKPLPQYSHHRMVKRRSGYASFRTGHLGLR